MALLDDACHDLVVQINGFSGKCAMWELLPDEDEKSLGMDEDTGAYIINNARKQRLCELGFITICGRANRAPVEMWELTRRALAYLRLTARGKRP